MVISKPGRYRAELISDTGNIAVDADTERVSTALEQARDSPLCKQVRHAPVQEGRAERRCWQLLTLLGPLAETESPKSQS